MKYNHIRENIQSGDLLAWSHRGWKSWYDIKVQLVRMFTRSEYSHIGIAWVTGGRVFVLEAVSSGVRIMPLSKLLPCYWISRGKWHVDNEAIALSCIGDPYSEFQAVLAGFKQLDRGKDSYWQCAEFVSASLDLPKEWGYTPSGVVRGLLEDEERSVVWLS